MVRQPATYRWCDSIDITVCRLIVREDWDQLLYERRSLIDFYPGNLFRGFYGSV